MPETLAQLGVRLERVVSALERADVSLDSALLTAVMAAAESFVFRAQRLVPVDTGTLFDSIRVEPVAKTPPHVQVKAGGKGVNPRTGRVVDYAAAVERRTKPYMAPAAAAVAPELQEAIRRILDDQLGVLHE